MSNEHHSRKMEWPMLDMLLDCDCRACCMSLCRISAVNTNRNVCLLRAGWVCEWLNISRASRVVSDEEESGLRVKKFRLIQCIVSYLFSINEKNLPRISKSIVSYLSTLSVRQWRLWNRTVSQSEKIKSIWIRTSLHNTIMNSFPNRFHSDIHK